MKKCIILLVALVGTTQVSASLLRQIGIKNLTEDLVNCTTGPVTPPPQLPATGILSTVSTQSASGATVEHTCLKDTKCDENTDASGSSCGTSDDTYTSCLVHKKKYRLDGEIDYNRHIEQQEASLAREVSKGLQTTTVQSSA